MGQTAATPVNEPESVFVVPSNFHFTQHQIQQLHDEGQQPGVPFLIDNNHAQRPKGRHVHALPIQNLISIRNDTIKLVFVANNKISVSFHYDSSVIGEAIMIIGGKDVSNRNGIRIFHQGKLLGPFPLGIGNNQSFHLIDYATTHIQDYPSLKACQQQHQPPPQRSVVGLTDELKSNEYDVIVLLIDKRINELKRNYGYPIYDVSYSFNSNSYSNTIRNSHSRCKRAEAYKESAFHTSLENHTPLAQNLRINKFPSSPSSSSSFQNILTRSSDLLSITSPKKQSYYDVNLSEYPSQSSSSSSSSLPPVDTTVGETISTTATTTSTSRALNIKSKFPKDTLQTKVDEINDKAYVLCEATFTRIEGMTPLLLESLLSSSSSSSVPTSSSSSVPSSSSFSSSISAPSSSSSTCYDPKLPKPQEVLLKTHIQRIKSSKGGDVYSVQEIYGLEQKQHHKSKNNNITNDDDDDNNNNNNNNTSNNNNSNSIHINNNDNNTNDANSNDKDNNNSSNRHMDTTDSVIGPVDLNAVSSNLTTSTTTTKTTATTITTAATINTAPPPTTTTVDKDRDAYITYSHMTGLITDKTYHPSSSSSSSLPSSSSSSQLLSQPNQNTTESLPFKKEEEAHVSESEQCVICLTDEKAIAVYPCRHFCMCVSCAETLPAQQNKCPICRAAVYLLIQL